MQCPTCETTTVAAFCRNCGKGVCRQCIVEVDGVAYCHECAEQAKAASSAARTDAPASAALAPPPPPPPSASLPASVAAGADAPNPALAGLLGVVPGLGAVYNGQYVKGVMHVVIFGMLMTLADAAKALAPLLIPAIIFFWFYMVVDAARTAQALRRGQKVDEMDGLAGKLFRASSDSPAAGLATIAVGVVLLLYTLGVLDLQRLAPYWPVLIIAFGVYRLYRSIRLRSGWQDRLESE